MRNLVSVLCLMYGAFLNPHGLTTGMIIMAIYLVLLYAQRKRFIASGTLTKENYAHIAGGR